MPKGKVETKEIERVQEQTIWAMKHLPWNKFLIVLAMVELCPGQIEKALTLVETTAAIIGLQQYFRSGCVFFLYSNGRTHYELRDKLTLVRLSKTMSQNTVTSATLNTGKGDVSLKYLRCQKNRPVNVLTSDDQNMMLSLKEMATQPHFARSVWLMLLSVGTEIDTFFSDIDVPVDSEFVVAHRPEDYVQLTEVYRVRNGYPLQKQVFGEINAGNKVLNLTDIGFYERRNNLHGLIMEAVTIQDNPYTSIAKNPDGSAIVTGGFFGLVWKEFENKLHFRTNFTYLEEKSYTYEVNDKTDPFAKMVYDVHLKKYDIGVAAFRCVNERAKIVEYTYIMHRSKFVIVLKPADNEDMAWNHFFGPFQPSLWFGLISCILVIAGCLSLFYYVGQRLAYPEYETPKQYTFAISIFYVFSMFCQQGHDVTPKSCACRLVYWLGYVTAVVVLAAYSATLISFLTIQNKEPHVKTLEALAADGTYKLGMIRHYVRIVKNDVDHGITNEIYDKIIEPDPNNIVDTNLEGFRRVCTTKYAFWTSLEAVKEVGDLVNCNIALLSYSYVFMLGMVVTDNNPYRRLLNYQISRMQSGGVLRKHKLDSWAAHVPEAQNMWTSVSVGQITPLLTILSGGVAISLALLLTEMVASWWQHRQTERKNAWSGIINKT
ncbi:glutamate receptor 1-like [Zootermopsis nevadensis]|uniref:glutamate receptor 1-like n=1 Tax=Zootermopsis nevadensis TaxID=136037 RepID=UPI000B8ECE90|nr:glutamate receptor 1-like [Zootermopsis nevadensis]